MLYQRDVPVARRFFLHERTDNEEALKRLLAPRRQTICPASVLQTWRKAAVRPHIHNASRLKYLLRFRSDRSHAGDVHVDTADRTLRGVPSQLWRIADGITSLTRDAGCIIRPAGWPRGHIESCQPPGHSPGQFCGVLSELLRVPCYDRMKD